MSEKSPASVAVPSVEGPALRVELDIRAPTAGYAFKQPMETALAVIGLVVSLPICLIIALLVWLEDRGPVFVHQVRVGKDGVLFRVIKFRTMRGQGHSIMNRQATVNDDRITRVGRILRATALDEIPQLLNILRGEMSLVGPRALLPREIEVDPRSRHYRIEDVPNYQVRISVPPGLTGLAQVYAPRDISRRKKFKYDALYIRKMSLWLDLKLIAASVFISLIGRWPRRGRSIWKKRIETLVNARSGVHSVHLVRWGRAGESLLGPPLSVGGDLGSHALTVAQGVVPDAKARAYSDVRPTLSSSGRGNAEDPVMT